MKRILIMILTVTALIVSLTGCGKKSTPCPECCWDFCYHPPVIHVVDCGCNTCGHVAVERIK